MKIFISLLLFINILYSQENKILSSYRSFEGGLNDYYASISLQENESPNLMNVVIDEPIGALTQRKGYSVCGQIPSGKTITNLYEYSKVNGSKYLIVTDNESIWQTADCVNFSTITTGLNGIDMPRFATVRDKVWIVNSSTWTITWDGNNKTELTFVPKTKYITYWKARVFLSNESTNPSSVYFSSLTDSSGTIISPESASAWSSVNQIYINRDDGSPIYGMKVYRDNLYIFKETGITRIIFESEEDIGIVKNVTTIGSKFNESIVEMDDGLLRFVGRDGVYAFDGSNIKRLSTKWTNTFEKFKQSSNQSNFALWDTNNDWYKGLLNNTTYTNDYLYLHYTTFSKWDLGQNGTTFYLLLSTTSLETYYYGDWKLSSSNENNILPYTYYEGTQIASWLYYSWYYATTNLTGNQPNPTLSMNWCSYNSHGDTAGFYFKIINKNEVELFSQTFQSNTDDAYRTAYWFEKDVSNYGVIKIKFVDVRNNNNYMESKYFDSNTIPNKKIKFAYAVGKEINDCGSNASRLVINIDLPSLNEYYPGLYVSSGNYTSEISTFTGVSHWKTFEVDETLNGQLINYFYRSSDTINGVINSSWIPISKGQVLSGPTDNVYFQWKADLYTYDNSYTPKINSVLVSYTTGDNTKSQIFGINYKSRYWVSASTSPNNQYNDITMVESKSPLGSYTKFDLPITAYAIWNNNLYGGIADKGYIVRLDYGHSDNGNAIISYWDTKDELFGSPIHYKSINRAVIDYSVYPINNNLKIGLSNDFGNNFEYKTINTGNNLNLQRNTSVLNYNANRNLQYRMRIYNDKYDTSYKVYGLHMIGTIGDYIGSK